MATFDFEVKHWPGHCGTAADALPKQPLAGGPQPSLDDLEHDASVVVCNIRMRTALGPELGTAGTKCCRMRQVCATKAQRSTDVSDRLGNTPTLPGYAKEELCKIQSKDPTISAFRQFRDRKPNPISKERKGLAWPVVSLLKQWDWAKVSGGLLY